MSALTDDQKKKIEENKRKALALRAAKQNTSSNDALSSIKSKVTQRLDLTCNKPQTPGSAKGKNSSFQTTKYPAIQRNKNQSTSGNTTKLFGQCSYDAKQNSVDAGRYSNGTLSTYNRTSDQMKSPNKAAAISGKCILLSRSRFLADVGYSAGLVEVFKSMPTRQYDVSTKKWSFHLKDHNSLLRKVDGLGSYVCIEGLPRNVLSVFDGSLKDVSETAVPDLTAVDSRLVHSLYTFQKDAVNFAIQRRGRVLIADDMGLGKTLQSLCIAAYYRREWPLLIVVPSSVRFTWREQVLKWLPSVDGQDINVVVTGKDSCTSGLVNIVSYDLMVKLKQPLTEKHFKVVIMDESHSLKNSKTARTQVALPILKRASRVVLLSGTPALSRPSELFSQIHAVSPSTFPKFHDFGVRYCDGKQNAWGWDFTGSSNLTELQLLLEETVMIRRLKQDVMDELPSKCRQMVLLDPSSVKINKVMKASHSLVGKTMGNERRGALLQYFHETGTAKVKAIREYVLDLLDSDRKFLVFAHHQEVLNSLEEIIGKRNEYIRIDGKTGSEQRSHLVNRFQKQVSVKAAILSITAANAGINLTSASLVVFAELFWNPGILMQAEDRTHRIGQQDSVTVHYLVAPSTADDYIWPLVQQKLEVLGKAGLSRDDFSEADTKRLKDPKQKEIMDYFEQSFMEDCVVDETTAQVTADDGTSTQSGSSVTQQTSLFQYFKPPQHGDECDTKKEQQKDRCDSDRGSNGKENKVTSDIDQLTSEEFDWLEDFPEDWDCDVPPRSKKTKHS